MPVPWTESCKLGLTEWLEQSMSGMDSVLLQGHTLAQKSPKQLAEPGQVLRE